MRHATTVLRTCLLLLPMLAACTLALPGADTNKPSPLAAEEIAVTKLDAADSTSAKDASVPPAKPDTAKPGDAEPATAAAPADSPPKAAAKTPDAVPAETAPPPAPLSAAALACTKKGGRYVKTGKGDLRACVKVTGDGGKQCRRESDCQGACLARSGTCAPVTPLFGCNDILQDDGRKVSLCLN